jgi:hypothetical protein
MDKNAVIFSTFQVPDSRLGAVAVIPAQDRMQKYALAWTVPVL